MYNMCNLAGAGKCDSCNDGYVLTATGTCAQVRPCNVCLHCQLERSMHFCMLHMGAALLTSPCAVCGAGVQCAANCRGCNNAGPGKCNPGSCEEYYGTTATGTCEPVRPCSMCLRFHLERSMHFCMLYMGAALLTSPCAVCAS